jgi:alpha-1,2-mannosyltransferase
MTGTEPQRARAMPPTRAPAQHRARAMLSWGVIGAAVAAHALVLTQWLDAHKLLIDLQVYRAGGEHVLGGQPLYDGGVLLDLPFVYPPFAAVVFAPLSLLPLPLLKAVWTGLTLVLLGYVVRRFGAGSWLAVAAFVALATWLDPVRTTLYLGQINVLVMALVVADMLGRPDSRWRGVGVGLAAALKLTPLLFVLYLLVTGRFRAAAAASGTFAAAIAVGFAIDPADSATYWLRGTFAAADRISDVAGTSNHSLNGLVARVLGAGAGPVYLAGAAVLVGLTLALARRAAEREAVVLVGLCSAAVAPFSWSHHWVWVVPLTVLLVRRSAWWLLGAVLVTTVAVITALPGPSVGPIPSTGLISLQPDVYVALFLVILAYLAEERARPRRVTGGASL